MDSQRVQGKAGIGFLGECPADMQFSDTAGMKGQKDVRAKEGSLSGS